MRGAVALALALMAAVPAAAQVATETGTGVVIRALDKMSGTSQDVTLPASSTARFERIEIDHAECRYPAGQTRPGTPSPSCACATRWRARCRSPAG